MKTATYDELVESTIEVLQLEHVPAQIATNRNTISSQAACEDSISIGVHTDSLLDIYSEEDERASIKSLELSDITSLRLVHAIGLNVAELTVTISKIKLSHRDAYIAYFKDRLNSLL